MQLHQYADLWINLNVLVNTVMEFLRESCYAATSSQCLQTLVESSKVSVRLLQDAPQKR